MVQEFKVKLPTPGILVDDDRAARYFTRISGGILAAAAITFLVSLLLAAEMRLTPEQRLDHLEVTTHASP
jgi:hypothetical protein